MSGARFRRVLNGGPGHKPGAITEEYITMRVYDRTIYCASLRSHENRIYARNFNNPLSAKSYLLDLARVHRCDLKGSYKNTAQIVGIADAGRGEITGMRSIHFY